jgi:hypothetical protein
MRYRARQPRTNTGRRRCLRGEPLVVRPGQCLRTLPATMMPSDLAETHTVIDVGTAVPFWEVSFTLIRYRFGLARSLEGRGAERTMCEGSPIEVSADRRELAGRSREAEVLVHPRRSKARALGSRPGCPYRWPHDPTRVTGR